MMRIFQTIAVALGLLGATVSTAQANYAERAEVKAMADRLAAKGLDRDDVLSVMSQAKRLDSVINAMNRPAEKKEWQDTRKGRRNGKEMEVKESKGIKKKKC